MIMFQAGCLPCHIWRIENRVAMVKPTLLSLNTFVFMVDIYFGCSSMLNSIFQLRKWLKKEIFPDVKIMGFLGLKRWKRSAFTTFWTILTATWKEYKRRDCRTRFWITIQRSGKDRWMALNIHARLNSSIGYLCTDGHCNKNPNLDGRHIHSRCSFQILCSVLKFNLQNGV